MKTILIAAMAKNNRVIGANWALPWHLPEDLANFRSLTMGKPVIMGRKTYESLPEKFRPLPWRRNVVISRNATNIPGADVCESPRSAYELLASSGTETAFVIGWSQTYAEFLERGLADELWISLVDGEFEGDAYFPEFETDFVAYESVPFERFQFVKYEKKS